MPFHFRDPGILGCASTERRSAGAVYAPEVLRHFAIAEYGGIALEDRLVDVTQPVLVLAGRHDRVCPADASERMARLLPRAELHVFEESAHMTFVEEPQTYVEVVGLVPLARRVIGAPSGPAGAGDRLRCFPGWRVVHV